MNTEQKIIAWAEVEWMKVSKELPGIVAKYGNEGLYICNQIKAAMASPTADLIAAALGQMIPGAWEASAVALITKALGIAIPALTNVVAHGSLPPVEQGVALVKYLQGLSPKMQHGGLLKLLSGLFQAIDPTLSEVSADTAAQVAYAHSVV